MAAPQPLTPFGNALAGALGGLFSNALVYPLDTAKTRLQALSAAEIAAQTEDAKDGKKSTGLGGALAKQLKRFKLLAMVLRIISTEGVSGAFKGFSASMINTFSMQFAYFFFHSMLRNAALEKVAGGLSTSSELSLGAAAGALAQIFTIPVAVVATRQQLWLPPPGASGKAARNPSLFETASSVVKEGGITALWTGLRPGLVLTINPAITYGCFERGKAWLLERNGGSKLSLGEAFWLGCLSKTLATVVTYPYIFAKIRLQARKDDPYEEPGTPHHKFHHRGALDILAHVYKEDGIKGWYQGMSAQIFKAVLCQGILFVSKDKFEDQARWILNHVDNIRATHPIFNKA